MEYVSLIFFLVASYFLGFTLTFFVRNSDNFLERILMRFGIGIAAIPFLGLLLNILRIPIDWKIILLLSLVYPIYYLAKRKPKPGFSLKLTKETIAILAMLLIFFANLYVHVSGAFAYPYLEDDDSWSHSIGV